MLTLVSDELINRSSLHMIHSTHVLLPHVILGGYICPSLVSYVQPRRARNIDGLWKVILNLRERYKGLEYKQNVRLEQCM